MTTAGFYRVFSYGGTRLGAGWREVYAEIGATTVRAIDWTTGDTAKLDVREWKRCGAEPSCPRRMIVRRCLKKAALLRKKTKLLRAALRATKKEKSHAT